MFRVFLWTRTYVIYGTIAWECRASGKRLLLSHGLMQISLKFDTAIRYASTKPCCTRTSAHFYGGYNEPIRFAKVKANRMYLMFKEGCKRTLANLKFGGNSRNTSPTFKFVWYTRTKALNRTIWICPNNNNTVISYQWDSVYYII